MKDVIREFRSLPGAAGRPAHRRLLLVGMIARIPHSAAGVLLTLHIVLTLGEGYAAAGAAAAVMTIGIAVGAPWRGRRVDTVGLRRALIPSVISEAVIWSVVPHVSVRVAAAAGVRRRTADAADLQRGPPVPRRPGRRRSAADGVCPGRHRHRAGLYDRPRRRRHCGHHRLLRPRADGRGRRPRPWPGCS